MRILIIEDNEISSSILESNLQQRHYETTVARTGTEALKFLETCWDIGLAIADIMVPEMDGLELVRRMREDPIWQEIPVIICTSLADSEHVAAAARLGCRHYLLKPIDRVKLLMMVEKLLSGRKVVPILGDRTQIATQYGLSAESINSLLQSFAKLIDATISALTSNLPETQDSDSRLSLARLAEGSVTLGAERLLIPLQAILSRGSDATPTVEERNSLSTELKLLQRFLTSPSSADQFSVANENKPASNANIIAGSNEPAQQPENQPAG
jgi:CheY-like chemotaxis protein